MYQKSLVILKPDAVQRRLVGRMIQRMENAGLKLHAIKFQWITIEQSRQHYEEHVKKIFYPALEEYVTSGPVAIMIVGGFGAVWKIRRMIGDTNPADAAPGTIRGDFAHQGKPENSELRQRQPLRNLIHASASPEDAGREIKLWFEDNQIINYNIIDDSLHGIE